MRKFRFPNRLSLAGVGLLAVCCSLVLVSSLSAAKRTASKRTKAITKLSFDPQAESVEFFKGIKDGSLDARLVLKDSKGGNLFIENKTDKPLTVKMPEAMVGIQVLKQFDGGDGGGGGGFGGETGGQGGGGGQPAGGGLGGGQGGGGLGLGGGGGQFGGGGGNFFSIPPEKIVKLPFGSVCLAHGKPEPNPRMLYRVIPVETFTKNPALQELIKLVGNNRIDKNVAQAAAWHISDKMSWRQLASKSVRQLGGIGPRSYFRVSDLQRAQRLVAVANAKAQERIKNGDVAKADDKKTRATPARIRGQQKRR